MKTVEERPDPFGTHEARNFPEDYSQENGNYINMCRDCGLSFRGNKHRIWCKMCDEPNWEELAKIQRPELPNPIPGAWLQGEMVGYARCMVKKVKPLQSRIEELQAEKERLEKENQELREKIK